MAEDRKDERLVVYDGDCAVCSRVAERLRDREWQTAHEIVAFQELPPNLADKMAAEGIEKQMLLYDPETESTLGGVKAIRELQLSSGRRLSGRLLGLPVISHLAALSYRLFSANRRFFR